MSQVSLSPRSASPPSMPKAQACRPTIFSQAERSTQTSFFESRLPRELQLSILAALFAQVCAAIPSPGDRFSGRAAAIRELIRLGRVSRHWLALVTDGQLWPSFDTSIFFHAFDLSDGIGISRILALRVLAGAAGRFIRELDLTGLQGITDNDLSQMITATWRASKGEEKTPWVKVNLTGCRQLTSKAINWLVRCSPDLKHLTLRGLPSVELGTMELIAHLDNIETVDLGYCPKLMLGPESILAGSWRSLRELRMSAAAGITDESLAALSALRQLQRLDLSHCTRLSDAGMKAFVTHGPPSALRAVNLSGCSSLTDTGLGTWAGCVPSLESLELAQIGSDLRDPGLIRLFSTTPRISKLDLEDANSVTDSLLECFLGKYEGSPHRPPLARPANTLESLCLSYAALLSERMMIRLILGSRNLSVLKLDNTRATDLVVRTFLAKVRGVAGAEISVIDCRRVSKRTLTEFLDLVRLRRGESGHWALALDYMDEDDSQSLLFRGDTSRFRSRSIFSAFDHRKHQVIDEMDETKVVLHSFHSWTKLSELEKGKQMRNLKASSIRRSLGEGNRLLGGGLSILRAIGVREMIEEREALEQVENRGTVDGLAQQVEVGPVIPLTTTNFAFFMPPKRSISCLMM